ncbi:MAG: CarD family transcriptional regulator [Tissierellia bacterium]|nr:CarD family transcriptional regulator [Tissierellia bacterium]
MFEIGDKIVYPIHGAGVIEDIEEKSILGETREYYILKIPVNDMRVLVPKGSMDEVGVRPIMSPEEMDRVFDAMEDPELMEMPKNWNRRYRFNQDIIKSGDLTQIAEVVKNLEALDGEKSLSTGERKMLNVARQIILSEMVLVYDKPYDEIESLVGEALEKSIGGKGEEE